MYMRPKFITLYINNFNYDVYLLIYHNYYMKRKFIFGYLRNVIFNILFIKMYIFIVVY